MNHETKIIDPDMKDFSTHDKSGKGLLLSSDDIQLIRNMAGSLESLKDRDYIEKLAKKEFITEKEKKEMDHIFMSAISRLKKGSTATA